MNEERYRTLLRRLGASLIDIWPIAPFLVALYIWDDLPYDHIASLLINCGMYLVIAGYYVVMHARTGQTIGKRICGVRVVTVSDESQISWKQSLLRESPMLLFFAVFSYFDLTIFVLGEANTPLAIATSYALAESVQRYWNFGDALCALCNFKRRSFHDLIGQTVVIKTS